MSTAVFPTLAGLTFPVEKTSIWDTDVQQAISGKQNRLAYFSYPLYTWSGDISVLLSSAGSAQDFQTLMGFYNARQGQFDSFLYTDPDDNSVTGQQIAIGDGVTTVFPVVRAFGGFVEPILAVNAGTCYVNGTPQTMGINWTLWGTSNSNGPGVIIFGTPPASGAVITVTMTYYWPCRFQSDKVAFSLDFKGMYSIKKLVWGTVRN